jgi:lipoate-protein ligase A
LSLVEAGSSLTPWRLLPSPPASGASNMALDQTILESAAAGDCVPSLRFLRWSPPVLSIGRFQPLDDIYRPACAAEGIEVVRRPTGGKSILHLDDFTYSIVIPRGIALPDSVVDAYRFICRGILRALEHLGLDAAIQPRDSMDYRQAGGACFAASTQADLEYDGHKLCGSAQVRRGGALLQHGSILLEDHSELLFKLLHFADEDERGRCHHAYRRRCIALNEINRLYEWPQLEKSFLRGFSEAFGVKIAEGRLSAWENERWAILTEAYLSESWLINAESRALPS